MKRYALTALLLAACRLAQADAGPLPALGADLTRTTVSGISSGGFMAAQLATAYSARFTGVGVIAAGPYYCAGSYPAQSLFANATTTCMSPSMAAVAPSAAVAWNNANLFAEEGLIDPVSNIGKQALYAFSGSSDGTVKTMVVDAVEQYYLKAGVAPQRIVYDKSSVAGHAIITRRDADVACAVTAPPFINNCGFDQAGTLLRHLYGKLSQPSNDGVPAGQVVAFNQADFVDSPLASMDTVAYAYVPAACQAAACAVHVALHGCLQGARQIGARFYGGAGYNEFADTNQLIILYPQAVASRGIPANPKGCWDFWGYSTTRNTAPYDASQPPFFAKGAPQMAAIVRMIERLGAPRGTPAAPPVSPTHR